MHTNSTLYVRVSPQRLSELRRLWPNVPWQVACELVSGQVPTLCLDSGIVNLFTVVFDSKRASPWYDPQGRHDVEANYLCIHKKTKYLSVYIGWVLWQCMWKATLTCSGELSRLESSCRRRWIAWRSKMTQHVSLSVPRRELNLFPCTWRLYPRCKQRLNRPHWPAPSFLIMIAKVASTSKTCCNPTMYQESE